MHFLSEYSPLSSFIYILHVMGRNHTAPLFSVYPNIFEKVLSAGVNLSLIAFALISAALYIKLRSRTEHSEEAIDNYNTSIYWAFSILMVLSFIYGVAGNYEFLQMMRGDNTPGILSLIFTLYGCLMNLLIFPISLVLSVEILQMYVFGKNLNLVELLATIRKHYKNLFNICVYSFLAAVFDP